MTFTPKYGIKTSELAVKSLFQETDQKQDKACDFQAFLYLHILRATHLSIRAGVSLDVDGTYRVQVGNKVQLPPAMKNSRSSAEIKAKMQLLLSQTGW